MSNNSTDAVLAQYERSKQAAIGSNQNKISQEERAKRYFTTVLPKNVKTEQRRIRILPMKNGESPFVEVRFHEIQVDGKWLKLYDPAQEGKRSPLNEVKEALYATGLPTDKELAKGYNSKTFYIVKLIDRDNEQDGPKFWRFKYNSKSDGVFDKIAPFYRAKGDIADPHTGRDLVITLNLVEGKNGRTYTTVASVFPDDVSPLHSDPDIIQQWVDDNLVWYDVYPKKGEDYLELVAQGEVPKWNTNLNKWEARTTEGAVIEGSSESEHHDPQVDDEPDEDLPF